MNRLPTWLLPVAWIGLISMGPAAATEPEKVRVSVVVILATDTNNHIDRRAAPIAREVQKIDPKLTGFRIASVIRKYLPVSAKETFPLLDNEFVEVTVEHGPDKEKRVGLRVKASGVGEITYKTPCGPCFPIVTPYQTKDKERLIVAVLAWPNTRKPKAP